MPEPEETMDVPHSEEGGNGFPPETPSVATTEQEAPVQEEQQPAPAAPAEQTLYELPDGRKVDGETLSKEWKENFLPEFTRKSQELARVNSSQNPHITTQTTENTNPYADPAYIPQTYEEIIAAAEKRALEAFEKKEADRIATQQAVETEVINQLTEIKKSDPHLDENALFLHANKYGFKDLRIAHQNMRDMSALIKTVKQQTVQNIQKRSDPVSTAGNQSSGSKPHPSNYATAAEYVRALRGE